MQAALLETFAAGNRIVRFAPQNRDDVQTAAVCSAYTDYVLFRQNDGFDIFSQVIHDGLMARVGVAKVFWNESTTVDVEAFENLSQDELDMLLATDDGIELIDSETGALGLVSGTVGIEYTCLVMIETIPPEQFLVEEQCRSLEMSNFMRRTTRAD